VDAQGDPSAWIGVLDRLSRDPVYAAYKARVRELLDAGPVVGVDSSRAMIAEATRRGLREAVIADGHELPFPTTRSTGPGPTGRFSISSIPSQR
jgi:hypothetical protein